MLLRCQDDTVFPKTEYKYKTEVYYDSDDINNTILYNICMNFCLQ